MSLIEDYCAECVRLVPAAVRDAEGGAETEWRPGELFVAAITSGGSQAVRQAGKDDARSLYTVTVRQELSFRFHDVFRRESDGKIFRVTSDSNDKQTPARASFRLAQFTAEEWRLPT